MSRLQRAAPTVVGNIGILMASLPIGALEKFQSGERLQLAVRCQRQPRRRQQEEQSISEESHCHQLIRLQRQLFKQKEGNKKRATREMHLLLRL